MPDTQQGLVHLALFFSDYGEHFGNTSLTYTDRSGSAMFDGAFAGKSIPASLDEILRDSKLAAASLKRLVEEGSVYVQGQLSGNPIKYHVMMSPDKDFFQAVLVDTSSEQGRMEDLIVYAAKALTRASFANHEETGAHLFRINQYAGKLAELMDMPQGMRNSLYLFSELHDVGKIRFADDLLGKRGRLTDAEFIELQKHTILGATIIGNDPRFGLARDIALAHHERWDGSGYPYGLAGENIPLGARIVAIVDVFDALASRRAYKPALGYDVTFSIMTQGDERTNPERHFDPRILRVFTENYKLFTDIHRQLTDKVIS